MDKLKIIGNGPLKGKIPISGAKNACLPLMAACLLSGEKLTLHNTPYLADVVTMAGLLSGFGVELAITDSPASVHSHFARSLVLNARRIHQFTAPYDMVRTMRASVLVLGPLLARFGKARVSLPGGCAIGTRPIDMHLAGLQALGAELELTEGYVEARVKGKLAGGRVVFDKVSVGATENILMAATLAAGESIIENAAREPEIVDLAECLRAMGAKIEGEGTSMIRVQGVKELHAAEHAVVADRIETGTYAACAAITGGEVELLGARLDIMESTAAAFTRIGIGMEKTPSGIRAWRAGDFKPLEIDTEPHPGFPTDMQAQLMALLTQAPGTSHIHEHIFENRFMHVPELIRMGAKIDISEHTAHVHGVTELKGAEVMATDLRASVSLVIAALVAKGETTINRLYHLDRGYERLEEKLSACGALVERVRG